MVHDALLNLTLGRFVRTVQSTVGTQHSELVRGMNLVHMVKCHWLKIYVTVRSLRIEDNPTLFSYRHATSRQ